MAAPLEQWFFDVPVVTRWWTTAVVATSVLCQCNLVNPFQLFLSFQTVWGKQQVGNDNFNHNFAIPISLARGR